ncbi:hypothetical protein HDU93_000890 [Gonapodya sp. JEL0774]|nr:hypothetical protein HDU93_000890 [Gonapodya sp. JEL0774]
MDYSPPADVLCKLAFLSSDLDGHSIAMDVFDQVKYVSDEINAYIARNPGTKRHSVQSVTTAKLLPNTGAVGEKWTEVTTLQKLMVIVNFFDSVKNRIYDHRHTGLLSFINMHVNFATRELKTEEDQGPPVQEITDLDEDVSPPARPDFCVQPEATTVCDEMALGGAPEIVDDTDDGTQVVKLDDDDDDAGVDMDMDGPTKSRKKNASSVSKSKVSGDKVDKDNDESLRQVIYHMLPSHRSCVSCQMARTGRHKPYGLLQPIDPSNMLPSHR